MNDHTAVLARIARDALGIESLEVRGRDGLDFHDLHVESIAKALRQAFDAGRRAAPPHHLTCPACGRDIEIRSLT